MRTACRTSCGSLSVSLSASRSLSLLLSLCLYHSLTFCLYIFLLLSATLSLCVCVCVCLHVFFYCILSSNPSTSAGKSTLLNLIQGKLLPLEGIVRVNPQVQPARQPASPQAS